jgi:signal peptidase I
MICMVIAAVIFLNLFTYVLQVVRYNGDAMEPNLHNRQTLLLRKTQDVENGDIVAFYYNNQVLVRRVIGCEGDQIQISSDGTVLRNSQPIDEPYLMGKSVGQTNIDFPYLVPENSFFVMGDYRSVAMDSRLREIGPVPRDRMIGKVIFAI